MKAIDPKPMGEYIDKTEAMRRFKPFGREIPKEQVMAVLARIDEGIVRCKDCKHWKDYECHCESASTDHEGGASYSLDRDANDYCSFGDRKE